MTAQNVVLPTAGSKPGVVSPALATVPARAPGQATPFNISTALAKPGTPAAPTNFTLGSPTTPVPARPINQNLPAGPNSQQPPKDRVNVVVIDDFNPQKNPQDPADQNFNHGESVAQRVQSGGAHMPTLQGRVDVQKINVGSPTDQSPQAVAQWEDRIHGALQQTIQQYQKDKNSVDAVNLSQQDPNRSARTALIQKDIQQLQAMGVPVAVAAGNNGPNQKNQLAPNNAFTVQAAHPDQNDPKSTTPKVDPNSGPGNLKALGFSTSFATPGVAPALGDLKVQGKTMDQIRQGINQEMANSPGGVLNSGDGKPVFTDKPTADQIKTPERLSLDQGGDSIWKVLKAKKNPANNAELARMVQDTLKYNNMTEQDATRMQVNSTFMIPPDMSPPPSAPAPQQPLPPGTMFV